MSGSRQPGKIHWIAPSGTETIEESLQGPSVNEMRDFLKGDSEHVTVLYKLRQTSMYVHEYGRSLWADRNPTATEIYFAASRARGIDPEDQEQAEKALLEMAKNLGVPESKIVRLDKEEGMAQKPGIYGPAILLEGFPFS